MDRDKQLAFCKVCTKREFSRQRGIVCSISGERADFIGVCPDFSEDSAYISKYGSQTKDELLDSIAVAGGVRFVNYLIDRLVIYCLTFGTGILLAIYAPSYAYRITKLEDYGIAAIIFVLYFIIFETSTQRTLGKLITGTVVINMDKSKPSFGQIIGRSFSRLIPFEALTFLGTNAIGWHDTFSKTRVVKKTTISNSVNSEILDSDFENEFS